MALNCVFSIKGNPSVDCISFSRLPKQRRGQFIMFSPLEGHPRRHFILFSCLDGDSKSKFTSFLNWKTIKEAPSSCFSNLREP